MSKTFLTTVTTLLFIFVSNCFVFGGIENLALKAKVFAGNEYDKNYLAQFAVDGIVPFELSKNDVNTAWAVRGENGRQTDFQLKWNEPVTVAEIVYFGRTAMSLDECFKDYEVFIDNNSTPVMKGTLDKKHGAQRITLPEPKIAASITLRFLNSYTDKYNPGASEIAVYSQIPSDKELSLFFNEKRTPAEIQLAENITNGNYGFNDLLVVERQHLNISHVYTYHCEGFQPGGGLCLYSPKTGTLKKIVDAGNGMIIDADLHWNGQEIVFSWKRNGRFGFVEYAGSVPEDISICKNPDENYQIYTVNIDGSNLRQITNISCNNLNACWLPDGGIAFISDRKPAYAYCFVTTSPVLYRMNRDGSNAKRLSANYLMDFTPSVLNDGRIIFTRWEYVDRAACPIQSLWTINPDGTNLSGYFKNRMIAPGTFMDANAIPNSSKIFALATNHNGPCIGGIVQIDQSYGSNSRDGVLNVTPEVNIYNAGWCWGNGLLGSYEKPFALDESTYLVTQSGDVQIRTIDGSRATLLRAKDATLSGNKKVRLGYYNAQPIREYPVPPVVSSSTLNETVVLPEDGRVSGNWAVVMVQDVYNGLEPTVKRGEIKRIAVVQELEKATHSPYQVRQKNGGLLAISAFGHQFPLVSCGATYAAKQVWGYADVNSDGSATFKVPSEVPIYFMAIDAEGRAVQRMRTFTHLMPGEVQGCVGCHVERNTQTPTYGNKLTARKTIPQELKKPAWGVNGFSYREIVQPVWDKHCLECHNPRQKDGGVDLSGDYTDFFCVSYEHLARKGTIGETNWLAHEVKRDSRYEGVNPYTSWIWTINGAEWNTLEVAPKRWGSPASLLTEILRSGHPDKDGNTRINVSQSERELVYTWIDLNVPYYPTSSSNHKDKYGSRRMYPDELDAVLHEVSGRRCAECHEQNSPQERTGGTYEKLTRKTKFPREFYTRFMNPQDNSFLLAPLAKEAGGTQKCSKIIFQSQSDPDYQKILETFKPLQKLIAETPRADMPDFVPPSCER
ncbi:MAG: hypothetical protein LBC02_06440 [Planctomycetaceae bacterium]|jgi:hypothetical protein|nr:hypothetical protein [Planctomycetaceae bacterium]